MEVDMFLSWLHWRLDNGQVSTRGRPRTSICFDVWSSYHHTIILIKIIVSFIQLLLDKINHRNQLEHDNKQFQSEKVHQCDLPNVTRGGDMRSYWNFLLITILFHKMMKYKMFVNKVQQCDLANVTRGGSMRSCTETSFCFVKWWSTKCSQTLTKDEPQGYQNYLIKLLISRNSASKGGGASLGLGPVSDEVNQ